MQYKTFAENQKTSLPPSLEAGLEIKQIVKVEEYTFTNAGETVKAMRVLTDDKEYKTTGAVVIEKLRTYFAENSEPLENIRIIQVKSKSGGRRYLDIEGF